MFEGVGTGSVDKKEMTITYHQLNIIQEDGTINIFKELSQVLWKLVNYG